MKGWEDWYVNNSTAFNFHLKLFVSLGDHERPREACGYGELNRRVQSPDESGPGMIFKLFLSYRIFTRSRQVRHSAHQDCYPRWP